MFEIGTLDQFADITMGQSPKGTSVSNKGEIPLLNGPTEFGVNHPTPVQFTNDPKRFAKKGDLLFCVRGSTGRMNWADQDYAIGRGLAAIRPKDGSSSHFLRGSVQFFLKHLLSGATGSVFTSINKDQLHKMECYLPDENNLKRINQMLGNFSGKIELNLKMNETIEDIAKTLFKSWFIDFDPVRAKAEGKPTGLSKEISDLFPDSFEDSELGEIPKGFEVDSVDNKYNISIGKTPPRKQSQWFSENHQDIPWVSIRDMGEAGIYIRETSEFLTSDAIEKFNIKVIPKNSVILSFKLTVGRVSILGNEMCTNEAIAHFVPKNDDLSEVFTYCLLKSVRYKSLSSTSSIATAVNSKIIKAMKLIFPNKSLLSAFNEICHPIFKKIELNIKENENLVSLRDALLPKLISGELTIPDTEKVVREASI